MMVHMVDLMVEITTGQLNPMVVDDGLYELSFDKGSDPGNMGFRSIMVGFSG